MTGRSGACVCPAPSSKTSITFRVHGGRLDFDALARQPDQEVITALAALPGIGRWTAEMFLIFGLKRSNVLALSDAGLQRAARLLYGEDAELETIGRVWQPYCSVASWYLWRHLDAVPHSGASLRLSTNHENRGRLARDARPGRERLGKVRYAAVRRLSPYAVRILICRNAAKLSTGCGDKFVKQADWRDASPDFGALLQGFRLKVV